MTKQELNNLNKQTNGLFCLDKEDTDGNPINMNLYGTAGKTSSAHVMLLVPAICNPSLINYNWISGDGRPFWKYLSKLPPLFDDCLTPLDSKIDPVEIQKHFDDFKNDPTMRRITVLKN